MTDSSYVKSRGERTRVQTSHNTPETKAVQSEKKSSDINNIVARAIKTGQLPVLMSRQPIEQLPDAQTYQEMLNQVVFAQQSFERLPAEIRSEFHNDPVNLLTAVSEAEGNEALTKKLQSMGILEIPEPSPQVPSAPPTPAQEPEVQA